MTDTAPPSPGRPVVTIVAPGTLVELAAGEAATFGRRVDVGISVRVGSRVDVAVRVGVLVTVGVLVGEGTGVRVATAAAG